MISFFRFLGRNKLYTAIEVIGLSVAMTFIVFISYYVFTELSYDSQLEDTEDVYLLNDGVFPAGSATGLWWVYVSGCLITLAVSFAAIVRQADVLVNVNPSEVLRKD